jgi:predicted transglutaminase-like cysteine proteinase
MSQFRNVVLRLAALSLAVMAPSGPAAADQVALARPGQSQPSVYMRVHRATLPPYGYVRFCREFPKECAAGRMEEARFEATPERMAELDMLNRHVNRVIEPATDQEIYGEIERWVLPVRRGDCEDYALLKRHMLMKRGWPASALLMTVVRDEKGEGHAVLTARTSKGDYILDNKTSDLKLWHQTPYKFVMRQSYIDPNVWLSLDPEDPLQSHPVAVARGNP